jgi:ferredoxin/flavodoxin
MAYKKLIIFYFSGTGNAKRITSWLSEMALKRGMTVQTFNISKIDTDKIKAMPFGFSDELIIIISPVHGFNFPPITLNFIHHFPKGNSHIVLMNTRAGMRVGNFVTPGVSGATFFWSSFILRRKGHKIVGKIPFDMPSNWISFHPALTDKATKFIHEKMHRKVEKHAGIIFSGQPDYLAHWDIVQDTLVLPVALAYYCFGRFFLAKSFYATKACDNCGICEKECAVRAIKNSETSPYWTLKCESCMRCMNTCPKRAIETTHGLWFVLAISTSPLSGLFCHLMNLNPLSTCTGFLIWNAILFILLITSYQLQYLLLKNKFFGKLIAFTSLTYYKLWGRYYSSKKRNRYKK